MLNFYSYYKFFQEDSLWVDVRAQSLIDCFYSDLELFFKKSFAQEKLDFIALDFFWKFHSVDYKEKVGVGELTSNNELIFQDDTIVIPKRWIERTDTILIEQSMSYTKYDNEDYFITFWNEGQNRIESYIYHPIIRKLGN